MFIFHSNDKLGYFAQCVISLLFMHTFPVLFIDLHVCNLKPVRLKCSNLRFSINIPACTETPVHRVYENNPLQAEIFLIP